MPKFLGGVTVVQRPSSEPLNDEETVRILALITPIIIITRGPRAEESAIQARDRHGITIL